MRKVSERHTSGIPTSHLEFIISNLHSPPLAQGNAKVCVRQAFRLGESWLRGYPHPLVTAMAVVADLHRLSLL